MGRPPRWRRVSYIPLTTYFKPAGIPLRELEEVCLSIEEVEAIRLKDLEDLEQEQCAGKMNVSRPTFVRVLDSGRKKLAEALIKGRAIRIEGGNFEMAASRFRCRNEHVWEVSQSTVENPSPQLCPTCNTSEITPVSFSGPEAVRGQSSLSVRGRGRRKRRGQVNLKD